ncbi:MAG: hypothetical protein JXP72_00340 [Coriobacteriia bacterium]|nr:hypothetical protein [Coriobacteriia bacterium]
MTTDTPRMLLWARAAVAGVLLLIGVAAVVGSIAAYWTDTVLLDTDTFVAAARPLATDTTMRDAAAEKVVASVLDEIGADALAGQLIPIFGEDLVTETLARLESFAQEQVRGAMATDQFATLWETNLRLWHVRFRAAVTAADAGHVATEGAEVSVALGPYLDLLAESSDSMVVRMLLGFVPADVRDVRVTAASIDPLRDYLEPLRTLTAAGPFLPWLAMLALLAGIIVAPRRTAATVVAGVAVAVASGGALLWLSSTADTISGALAAQTGTSAGTAAQVVTTLTTPLAGWLEATVAAALVAALVGGLWWFLDTRRRARLAAQQPA